MLCCCLGHGGVLCCADLRFDVGDLVLQQAGQAGCSYHRHSSFAWLLAWIIPNRYGVFGCVSTVGVADVAWNLFWSYGYAHLAMSM